MGKELGRSGQRVKEVGRALHVVGMQLQSFWRRRGAVDYVARLAEEVRGGGGAWAGRGGQNGGGAG